MVSTDKLTKAREKKRLTILRLNARIRKDAIRHGDNNINLIRSLAGIEVKSTKHTKHNIPFKMEGKQNTKQWQQNTFVRFVVGLLTLRYTPDVLQD